MILILILFTPIYAALLFWCLYGLASINNEEIALLEVSTLRISLVIPFRNESENIQNIARDVLGQSLNPDWYEVIWVNDHSDDDSMDRLQSIIKKEANHSILEIQDSQFGKKQALKFGIDRATGSIIVTTDADCKLQPKWLETILGTFQLRQPDMLLLSVGFIGSSSLVQSFQKLENLAIQGISFGMAANGMPVSCNGANLAFIKQTYNQLGGYDANMRLASGDDMFLLNSFLANGKVVTFCWSAESMVYTKAETTWSAVFSQRRRWAGKMTQVKSRSAFIVGTVLLLHAIFLWISMFWLFIDSRHWSAILFVIVFRVAVDALLIKTVASHYNEQVNPLKLTLISGLYWIYFPIIIILSKIKKTYWKGREI